MRPAWHVTAWRLLWIGPLAVCGILFCFFCLLCYGPRDARRAWKDTIE